MQETTPARRRLLKIGTAAGGALALVRPALAAPAAKPVAKLSDLAPGKAVAFNYPDQEPAYAIDTGQATPGGIGPRRSIVAFSALCQHMGCPVNYDAKTGQFVCPCHASVFDPGRAGQAVEGPSTRGLPRIRLRLQGDQIVAVGIEAGPVYGRACDKA